MATNENEDLKQFSEGLNKIANILEKVTGSAEEAQESISALAQAMSQLTKDEQKIAKSMIQHNVISANSVKTVKDLSKAVELNKKVQSGEVKSWRDAMKSMKGYKATTKETIAELKKQVQINTETLATHEKEIKALKEKKKAVENTANAEEKAGKKTKKTIEDIAKTTEKSNKKSSVVNSIFSKKDALAIVNNLKTVSDAIDKIFDSWKKAGGKDNAGAFRISFANRGANDFFNEFGNFYKSYKDKVLTYGKDEAAQHMGSGNLFTELFFGSKSNRAQAITSNAESAVRAAVTATDEELKKQKRRTSRQNPFEFSSNNITDAQAYKEVNEYIKNNGAKSQIKSWEEADTSIKKVITSLLLLKEIDGKDLLMATGGKYYNMARNIASQMKATSDGMRVSYGYKSVSKFLDSPKSAGITFPRKDDLIYERDAARKKAEYKASAEEKQKDPTNILAKELGEAFKGLQSSIDALKDSIASFHKGLTTNDNGYKIHIGNEGAEYFFRGMKELFEPYMRPDIKEPHNRLSRSNAGNPVNKDKYVNPRLHDDIVKIRRNLIGEGVQQKPKNVSEGVPIPLDVFESKEKYDAYVNKVINGENISENLKNAIKEAISEGILEGIQNGMKAALSEKGTFAGLSGAAEALFGDKPNANRAKATKDIISNLNISKEERLAKAQIESHAQVEKEKVRQTEKSARARADLEVKLEKLKEINPEKYNEVLELNAKEQELRVKRLERLEQEALEKKLEKEERFRIQRARWNRDDFQFRNYLAQFDGKELTKQDQLTIKLKEQREEYTRIYEQAMMNKGNNDAHLRALRKMSETKRELIRETLKEAEGYDKMLKKAEKFHNVMTQGATILQRTSAMVGSLTSIFSTLRTQAQNIFKYMQSAISKLTGGLRTQLSQSISAGVEQFNKLEQSKIAFESFYGPKQADAVISQVRAKALQTPIVDAGSLSDYVAQLAPVSNGDSQLAIDAALGALKTLKYSGVDSSEMEYVIKNIRDVVAKGKATAIDMRQFQRALPAIEKALNDIGASDFLKDGQLSITPQNAKQILSMFAQLNNDPNSPVANIDERLLQTTDGLKSLVNELKTNTFEEIYRKSGIADLYKDFLKMLTDQKIWTKFTDFVGGALHKVVDIIRGIDWESLGKRMKEGWERISKVLQSMVGQIAGVMGIKIEGSSISDLINDFINNDQAWNQIWEIITAFLTSFAEGMKQTLAIFKEITKNIDPNFLKNVASMMGYMMSPMGKIWTVMGGLLKDMLNGAGRLLGSLDSANNIITNIRKKLKDRKIEKGVNLLTSVGAIPEEIMPTGKYTVLKGMPYIENTGLNKRGKPGNFLTNERVIKRNASIITPDSDTYLTNKKSADGSWERRILYDYNKGIGNKTWNPKGPSSKNWSDLTLGQKIKNVGVVDTAKYYGSQIADFAKEFTGKTVQAFETYAVGTALTSVVSSIVGKINPQLGQTTQDLGDLASAAIAGGKAFGLWGAAGGLLIASIGKLIDANAKLDATQKEAIRAIREGSLSTMAKNVRENVMDNLVALGMYKEDDKKSEDAWNAVVNEIYGMSEQELSDPEVLNRLMKVYTDRRGQNGGAEIIEDYIPNMTTGTTALSDTEENTARLKRIALYLKEFGFVNDLDEDKIARLDQGGYDSWAGYLSKNGAMVGSVEAADELISKFQEADGVKQEWMSKYENSKASGDFKWYVEDDDGKKIPMGTSGDADVMKQWMESQGFVWLESEKCYRAQANIDAEITSSSGSGLFGGFTGRDYGVQQINNDSWRVRDVGTKQAVTVVGLKDLQTYVYQVKDDLQLYDWIDWLKRNFSMKTLAQIIKPDTTEASILGIGKMVTLNTGGYISPVYHAAGGYERGVDTVPAMLQPGEFVMRRSSVNKAGLGVMSALNRGDLGYAARLLGTKTSNSWNNSRNWSNVTNNNQRASRNNITIINRSASQRTNSYVGLANRIALA